jgi:hypothetical protein
MLDVIINIDGKNIPFQKRVVKSFPLDVNLTVPNDGFKYVLGLHDYEYNNGDDILNRPRQMEYGIKYPIPAMLNEVRLISPQGKTYDYITLVRDWQYFLFDLWKWSVGDAPMGKWEGTYKNPSNPTMTFDRYTANSLLWYYAEMIQDARSHTDAEPVEEGFQDYVTNRNLGKKPYSWLCKSTTGNLFRVLDSSNQHWVVEGIDLLKPVPRIEDIIYKPWLLHWATQQTTEKRPDGTYVVSRYPQAKIVNRGIGLPDTGTPIPNVCLSGKYLLLKARTKDAIPGTRFSPYNPMK